MPDPAAIAARIGDEERDKAVAALKQLPLAVVRAHRCISDDGFAYVQSMDPDQSALRAYVVDQFASHAARALVRGEQIDTVVDRAADALVSETTSRVMKWPVLGLRLTKPLALREGLICRPPTEEERVAWSGDFRMSSGEARDILACECVVESVFNSEWPTRTAPVDLNLFETEGFARAADDAQDVIALMRLLSGWHLPLLFVDTAIQSLPWVQRRDWLPPRARDFHRRRNSSPLFANVEWAENAPAEFVDRLKALWERFTAPVTPQALVLATRLFSRELDFVTLYKVVELIPGPLKDKRRADVRRFRHTANSPDAVPNMLSRHAKQTNAPPSSPMSIVDARELVRDLMNEWFAAPVVTAT